LLWQEESGLLGCSECGWVFRPGKPAQDKPPEEIALDFALQRDKDFAAHVCTVHPRTKPPKSDPAWPKGH
jgi:hypothetical protein